MSTHEWSEARARRGCKVEVSDGECTGSILVFGFLVVFPHSGFN
jgi:hypothetical protein